MVEIKYQRRTVVRNAHSRYLALPPLWLKEHDILPGEILELIRQEDGSLRVQRPIIAGASSVI